MIMAAANTARIKVLVADDDQLMRAGIRALIDGESGIDVVGEASDGAEAVALTGSLAPDVICMDVRMPHVDGIQATRLITARYPAAKVMVLTTFENDGYVHQALAAGAHGFLLKRAAPTSVVQAIVTVNAGESLLFPDAIRQLLAHTVDHSGRTGLPMLSPREADVLRQIARGQSNSEIAAELYITLETVKTHVGSILQKLGVRDRVQAVVRAYESGFITVP